MPLSSYTPRRRAVGDRDEADQQRSSLMAGSVRPRPASVASAIDAPSARGTARGTRAAARRARARRAPRATSAASAARSARGMRGDEVGRAPPASSSSRSRQRSSAREARLLGARRLRPARRAPSAIGCGIDVAHQPADVLHLPPPAPHARVIARAPRDRVDQALGQVERRRAAPDRASTSASPSSCSACISRLRARLRRRRRRSLRSRPSRVGASGSGHRSSGGMPAETRSARCALLS